MYKLAQAVSMSLWMHSGALRTGTSSSTRASIFWLL